jgi:4-amino-4-deoxy-L-arabinose transferase-like glycosyltransferase
MNWPKSSRPLLYLAFTGYIVFLFWGVHKVPFHPDESTYLYMSADFEMLLSAPRDLGWNPVLEGWDKQRYLELDAPLTRYWVGLGRSLAGLGPLAVDWDWGESWQENARMGALPRQDLLLAGRYAVTLLLPAALALIYLAVRSMAGPAAGVLAASLMASHSLILVHTRRAMAEGALTFGMALFLFSLTQARKRPWLVGLAAALAFNAKQSAVLLLPIGVLAVLWTAGPQPDRWRRWTALVAGQLAVFAAVTLALNPLLWSDPINAMRVSIDARQDLLERQVADSQRLSPGSVAQTPGERALVLAANLYITPPSFSEVGNYRLQTRASEEAYLSIPGHELFRGMAYGGVFLFLTVLGLAAGVFRLRKNGIMQEPLLCLMLLTTVVQAGALSAVIPLPWQRYAIPLVPLESVWVALAVVSLADMVRSGVQLRRTASPQPAP